MYVCTGILTEIPIIAPIAAVAVAARRNYEVFFNRNGNPIPAPFTWSQLHMAFIYSSEK